MHFRFTKTYTKEIIEIAIYLSIFGWQGYTIKGKGYIIKERLNPRLDYIEILNNLEVFK